MRSNSWYPRERWAPRLSTVFTVLAVAWTIVSSILIGVRTYSIHCDHIRVRQVQAANHLWRMSAGVDPIDRTALGTLASTMRDLRSKPDPVLAFRNYYVNPGMITGIDEQLGFTVAERLGDNNSTLTNEGPFTDRFVLNALEANANTYQHLVVATPPIRQPGLLSMPWMAVGSGGLLAIWLFLRLLLVVDRSIYPSRVKRWELREKKEAARERLAELAALPSDDARTAFLLVEKLSLLPTSRKNGAALKDAKRLLDSLKTGLDDHSAEHIRQELVDLEERWRLTQSAYHELPQP